MLVGIISLIVLEVKYDLATTPSVPGESNQQTLRFVTAKPSARARSYKYIQ